MKTFLRSVAIGATALALTLVISGTSRGQTAPASIAVSVPADAKVWFDDSPTQQTGAERSFESPPLKLAKTYSYTITAQWRDADGTDVIQKRQVSVRANESSNVEFVPRTSYYYEPTYYYPNNYDSGNYYGGGRRFFGNYYRVGNVIINGRRWGDIGYRYSHADLIRW
jgi:uncharacterized protein (TIGR03000 family)